MRSQSNNTAGGWMAAGGKNSEKEGGSLFDNMAAREAKEIVID